MRTTNLLRLGALLIGLTLAVQPVAAQDAEAKAREEWMAGYVKLEEGGRAEEAGDVAQALALYRDALQTFEDVRRRHPGWNPSLLGYRITYCTQRIRRIESQVKQQSTDMSQPDLAKMASEQVDKIRVLTDENQALKQKLAVTAEALERARVESARTVSASEDIKDVMAERARFKDENTALRQQVEQLTADVNELRRKSGIEQVAKQLQGDLDRTRAREQQLEQAFDTYRKAYDNVKEKLRQTTAEQEQWVRQNRDMKDRTDAAVAEAAEARRKLAELETRVASLDQRRADDAAALAQRQTDVEQARRDLEQARTELAELRRLRDQAAQEAGDRQRLVEQSQQLLAAKTAAEERAAALGKDLGISRNRLAALEKQDQEGQAARRAESAELLRERDGLRDQVKSLADERSQARADQLTAKTRQADLQQQLDAALANRAKLESGLRAELASLQQKSLAAEGQHAEALRALEQRLQQLQGERDQAVARASRTAVAAEPAGLQQRLEAALAERAKVESDLRREIAALQARGTAVPPPAAAPDPAKELQRLTQSERDLQAALAAQEEKSLAAQRQHAEAVRTLEQRLQQLQGEREQEAARAGSAVADVAALRRDAEALRTALDQERQQAAALPGVEAEAMAVMDERDDLERRLTAAQSTVANQQALLQAQGEKLASAAALGRLLEDKEKALATSAGEVEALRQDLVRERTALAELRDQARETQANLQRLTARAADLEKLNTDYAAQIREKTRADEDAGRLHQDAAEQLTRTRDMLTAAEGERAQLRQKSEEQLALLRQQEKSLRDLETQRRDLAERNDLLTREMAALKKSNEERAAAFTRDAATMKAKTEVVDGLAASLTDVETAAEKLRLQVRALEQDKVLLETRVLEARRQVEDRDQEIARFRAAARQSTAMREQTILQQLKDTSARLEAETEKRRAVEAALAALPAPGTREPAAKPAPKTASPVDPERERREAERAMLVRGYLRQAVAAEKDGKVEAARWNYERVLEQDGENKLAAQRLGLLSADHGNDEDAERYLKRAFKLDPDDLQTIMPLGFALLRRQEPDLAVSMLSRAVALEPGNAVAHRCLGLACSSLGWYDAAEVQFRRAQELNSKDGENAFNLAVLLSSRQPPRLQEARQWYEQALALGVARDPGLDRLFGVGK